MPRRWGRMFQQTALKQVSRDPSQIKLNHDHDLLRLRLRPRQTETERRTTDRQHDRRRNEPVAAVAQASKCKPVDQGRRACLDM